MKLASRYGHVEIVKLLLDNSRVDPSDISRVDPSDNNN